VTVTWIVDQALARAEALAGDLGARATAEASDALADSAVDAVVIAAPTPAHRFLTERAAAHGKHVFCEKPIARTAEDARAMVDACRQHGVRLMVGHVVRFFPEYVRIKEVLDEGAVGTVGVVRAARLNQHPRLVRPWYGSLEESGGLIIDLMIHDLDTLRWYFGEAERVFAHGLSYTPHQANVDHAVALLRFAGGEIAHVEGSWAHTSFRTAIEIAGDQGLIRHASDDSAAMLHERPEAGTSQRGVIVRSQPQAESPYARELRHFTACLADGSPFLVDGEEASRSLDLALAVLESVRTGEPVHLAPQEIAR
jgi:predicted dehydrogenase